MRSDELISRIRLPRTPSVCHYARKVGTRKAQAISKICFAGVSRPDGGFRIALGSVAPTVLRCPLTESALQHGADIEEARAILASELAPIDDIRSTAAYRLRVAQNLLQEFVDAVHAA